MTDAQPAPLPEWIAEILALWVPPDDYDARLSAVADGYLADLAKKGAPRPPTSVNSTPGPTTDRSKRTF